MRAVDCYKKILVLSPLYRRDLKSKVLLSSYKPADGGMREPLYRIIEVTFPALLKIFQASLNHNSLEVMELQKLLCKIFWTCTHVSQHRVPSLPI